ncbi:MAG: bacteriorhodopsin [Verrucomicrobiota bacterium]
MENMENFFTYQSYQWDIISHILVFGVGATLAGLVYFIITAREVAPKYRMSNYLSAVVMVSAAIILFNQQQSWDRAFTYDGEVWSTAYSQGETGTTFSNGYRYLNWSIDVPMLLLQILFVVPVAAGKFKSLAVGFGLSGLAMVVFSYIAQVFEYGFNPEAPDSGAVGLFWVFYILGWIAYLIVLWIFFKGVMPLTRSLSTKAAGVMKGIAILFLISWTIYGIVIAIPAFAWNPSGSVWRQVLFTIVDVTSKVVYGAMLSYVCMLRSAEDGYQPAVESMGGGSAKV